VLRLVEWPHLVNLVSMGLIAGGCWLMGKQDESRELKQYVDNEVGGLLMITVGTATISTSTFSEILEGTKHHL